MTTRARRPQRAQGAARRLLVLGTVLLSAGCGAGTRNVWPAAVPVEAVDTPLAILLPAPPRGAHLAIIGGPYTYRGGELYDFLGTRALPLYRLGLRAAAQVVYEHATAGRLYLEVFTFKQVPDEARLREVWPVAGGEKRIQAGTVFARAGALTAGKKDAAAPLLDALLAAARRRIMVETGTPEAD